MSSAQKSIVILVPGFPGSEAETDCLPAVQNFVKAISQRNPDIAVHVISFQYPFRRDCYLWNGATVHALAGMNKRFPFRFRTWFQAAREVRRLMASHEVLAVHSFWLAECTYVAAWLARTSGTRHIATICGQDALAANPYLKHLGFEKMIVTANSENAAKAFSENTGRRVDHVIPAGLDTEAKAAQTEITDRSIDVLGVGSLSPIKNFGLFLDVVASLTMKYPDLRCMILGEGPERPSLERQIREQRLTSVVRLAGHIPREKVLSTMRKSKILLHTASYEGQGYVFLEALASGMRVVSLDVGYTGNGAGAFVCKSEEEMKERLQMILASPFAPAAVHVKSIDDTARAYEEIYGLR